MGLLDANQFTDLIRQHRGLIYKVAFAYCQVAADREDVVQEIAVQLWRCRANYDEQFRVTTWIYRIALNVAISFYRRERRHRHGRQPLDEQHLLCAGDEDLEPSADVERLLASMQTLGAIEKALVLLYLDGNEHAVIADVLGTSVSNIGTRLHRIKAKLRTAMTVATPHTSNTNDHATR